MLSKSYLSTIFFALITLTGMTQMKGELEMSNPNGEINNAEAVVRVEGAVAPLQYKWSIQSVSLNSDKATGITEGRPFSVEITDAGGNELLLEGEVSAESAEEHLNSMFIPVVNAFASVFFWDPLEATGIRDPHVYQSKKVMSTDESWAESGKVTLQNWLVRDGQSVNKGDALATLTLGNEEKTVYAAESGKINRLVDEGEVMYDKDDAEGYTPTMDMVEIIFPQKRFVTHPNGDPKKQGVPIIVLWLVCGAIFFTLRMKFINFRGVKHAIHLVQGKYDDPDDEGEVSHFQALTTALSATVGLGNIAGVAVAIAVGGPGATFWMILAGLLGMASKFTECTLGVKYRKIDENGVVSGGPMYYLSQGLAKQNKKGLGRILALLFAMLCVGASFGGGNMFQANQAFAQLSNQFPGMGEYGFVFGIILAILVGVVIIGGIKSIAKVTDKIVPFMCGVYVLFSLIIIFMNITNVGAVIQEIFLGAFSAPALKGGFVGVLILGFQRAAFSNEAGVGSASIAHSASKTKHPVSEGFVALLEPFVDTVVVCTMTAMVLIFTGFADGASNLTGSELTSEAFSSVFPWFSWVLMVAILLFAFSTMISWSYYGLKAWGYLFGDSKRSDLAYKFVFLVFIVVGSSAGLGAVLDFSDLMILGMAFPNILGLLFLSKEVRMEMIQYYQDIRSGVIKRFK